MGPIVCVSVFVYMYIKKSIGCDVATSRAVTPYVATSQTATPYLATSQAVTLFKHFSQNQNKSDAECLGVNVQLFSFVTDEGDQ